MEGVGETGDKIDNGKVGDRGEVGVISNAEETGDARDDADMTEGGIPGDRAIVSNN